MGLGSTNRTPLVAAKRTMTGKGKETRSLHERTQEVILDKHSNPDRAMFLLRESESKEQGGEEADVEPEEANEESMLGLFFIDVNPSLLPAEIMQD
jgi:hypothetical protein